MVLVEYLKACRTETEENKNLKSSHKLVLDIYSTLQQITSEWKQFQSLLQQYCVPLGYSGLLAFRTIL